MLNSAWDIHREVPLIALRQLLYGFRRRARRLLQRLVELGQGRLRLAQLSAQLRRRNAQQLHDLIPARSVLPDSRDRISALASDRIQLDPKVIALIRDGTGDHYFAVRAKAHLMGDLRRNLRIPWKVEQP